MPAPLAIKLRSDLQVSREIFGTHTYVVIKDPLALRYFRFQEEEFAILELLNGSRSLEEIRTVLEAKFAPQKFSPEGLSRFVTSLHATGLVTSERRGQGSELLQRHEKSLRRQRFQWLMNPLAIRIRGLDPTWAFDRMLPWFRWCFAKTALLAATILCLSAALLVAVRHEELFRKLPTFQQFFTPGNMFLLLGLLGAIKICHELGHALTCRRFGGECHELGLMLLVFAPCLYCNVTDSWRLPKRERIAIAAAGMIVELVIMACAVFGWWASGPGLFNQLCLGALFVTGLSTLVINGNPLMRYDGYFILSDLVETPNLADKSAAALRNLLTRGLLGVADEPDPLSPRTHRGWFITYAILSTSYRLVVSYSIFLFMLEWLRPYHLEVIARVFGLTAAGGLIVPPLWRTCRYMWSMLGQEQLRRARVGAVILGATALVVGSLSFPFSQCVWGTFEVEPRNIERLFVEVPGRIVTVMHQPGTMVTEGALIAQLENPDLEIKISELDGRATQYRAQLESLRRERFHQSGAALRIPELLSSLQAVEDLLTEKRTEHSRLALVAPRAGIVLPPPESPARREAALGELPGWSGLPTHPGNRGATLEPGTLVCQIGNEHEWEALVAIDQDDVALLTEGQAVEIRFDHHAHFTVKARVEEISQREIAASSRRLSNKGGGELATMTDDAGVERPMSPTYYARVVLYDPTGQLRIGMRGTARIHVASASLGSRALRSLRRTFHFDW